jgi:hypothetical protein
MDPKSDKSAVPAPAARPSLFAAAPSARVAAGPAQASASTSLLSAIERVDGSPARPAGSRRSPWSGGMVFMLAAAALLAGYIALSRQSDGPDATARESASARGVPAPSTKTTSSAASPGANAQAAAVSQAAAASATAPAAAAEPAAAVARLETLPGDAPRDLATAESRPVDAAAKVPTAPDIRQSRSSAATTRPAGELREGISAATRGATGNASSRAPGTAAANVASGSAARAAVPRAATQPKPAERLPAVRPASPEARELMARAEALEGKAPAINNLPAPSAAPARPAPQRDPDVELLAAMMQHIEPGQAPAAATTDPATADSGPGTTTTIAQLVKRCSTLADRSQRQACQERICDGYWGKAQACPATPAKPRTPGAEAAR